jgi:hypothetical protein
MGSSLREFDLRMPRGPSDRRRLNSGQAKLMNEVIAQHSRNPCGSALSHERHPLRREEA